LNHSASHTGGARTVRIIYGALFAGLVLLGVALAVLRLRHWSAFGSGPTTGVILAVLSVALIAATVLLKIPARAPDQTPGEYWAADDSRRAALALWFLIEAAGILGWVGHLLTGSSLAAGVAGLAMAWLFFVQPSRLENMGAAYWRLQPAGTATTFRLCAKELSMKQATRRSAKDRCARRSSASPLGSTRDA
jgi:hypothetical protein